MAFPPAQARETSDALGQNALSNEPLEDIRQPELPPFQDSEHASSVIKQYLLDKVPEFRRLVELREKGWRNPEGDRYFQNQRLRADQSDEETALFFYDMMKNIGQEMHRSTGALAIREMAVDGPTILDMCMAPGGFLATALSINPRARAVGFSLPISEGGHKTLLPSDQHVTLKFLDITMLAADLGVTDIPVDHPESKNMLPQQLDPGQLFDLVLCDGQVLRTHVRPAYRERREARRLTVTQLAIGLERVKVGGTMVVLLHRVETPNTVSLLYSFSKFSSIKLFKSTKHHAKRSSFYMIATDIQNQHPEALLAVKKWKSHWRVATFGTDVEYEQEIRAGEPKAEELLTEFGAELARLGKEIWDIQASALAKAPFVKNGPFVPGWNSKSQKKAAKKAAEGDKDVNSATLEAK